MTVPVADEVALPVDHVGDHHHLVDGCVRELERQLRRLDVEGQDDTVRGLD